MSRAGTSLAILLALAALLVVLECDGPRFAGDGLERPGGPPDGPSPPAVLRGPDASPPLAGIPHGAAAGTAGPPPPRPASARRLEGVVVDDRDTPVEGILLRAAIRGAVVGETRSRPDGTFEFPALAPVEVFLTAEAGDRWWGVAARQVPPEASRVRVRLTRAISLRLRVLDPDGSPAAGIRVQVRYAWGDDQTGTGGDGLAPARTAGDGSFVAPRVPAGADVDVDVGGERQPEVRFWHLTAGDEELVLRRPRRVIFQGTVRDESGRPLGGVTVTVRGGDPRTWNLTRQGPTDPSTGRFCFDDIAPGRYGLDVAPPPGWSAAHSSPFVDLPGGHVDVVLFRSLRASGHVVLADPSQVVVTWHVPGAAIPAAVGPDGSFALEGLPDLPASLLATNGSTGDAGLLEGVRPSDGPFAMSLQAGGQITGRVEGARFPHGAEVSACRGPLRIPGRLQDDSFLLTGLPPGPWSVELWEMGACLARVEGVEAGGQVILVPRRPDDPSGD